MLPLVQMSICADAQCHSIFNLNIYFDLRNIYMHTSDFKYIPKH